MVIGGDSFWIEGDGWWVMVYLYFCMVVTWPSALVRTDWPDQEGLQPSLRDTQVGTPRMGEDRGEDQGIRGSDCSQSCSDLYKLLLWSDVLSCCRQSRKC